MAGIFAMDSEYKSYSRNQPTSQLYSLNQPTSQGLLDRLSDNKINNEPTSPAENPFDYNSGDNNGGVNNNQGENKKCDTFKFTYAEENMDIKGIKELMCLDKAILCEVYINNGWIKIGKHNADYMLDCSPITNPKRTIKLRGVIIGDCLNFKEYTVSQNVECKDCYINRMDITNMNISEGKYILFENVYINEVYYNNELLVSNVLFTEKQQYNSIDDLINGVLENIASQD